MNRSLRWKITVRQWLNKLVDGQLVPRWELWEKVGLLLLAPLILLSIFAHYQLNEQAQNVIHAFEVVAIVVAVAVVFRHWGAPFFIRRIDALDNSLFDKKYKLNTDLIYNLETRLPTGIGSEDYTIRYIDEANSAFELTKLSEKLHEYRAGHDTYNYAQRSDLITSIYKKNKHFAVLVLNKKNELIGSIVMFPMKRYLSNKHYSSRVTLDRLPLKDIANTGEKEKLIYIHSICLQTGNRFANLKYYFQSVVYHQVHKFMQGDNAAETILYSEQFTKMEKKLLYAMGCHSGSRISSNQKHVHELHFSGFQGNKEYASDYDAWKCFVNAVQEYKLYTATV